MQPADKDNSTAETPEAAVAETSKLDVSLEEAALHPEAFQVIIIVTIIC